MKKLISRAILLLICMLSINSLHAQEEEEYEPMQAQSGDPARPAKKWQWSRARIGGNFGLQFGDVTYLDLSPSFGYYVIEDKLQVGLGFKNVYLNQKHDQYYYYNGILYLSPAYRTYLFGPSIFSNYNIWRGIFVHGEYELINKEPYFPQRYDKDRINVSHLLIGGGYTTEIGRAGNFYISALYNVLDGDESIYEGTFGSFPLILRLGFGFGIAGK